MKLVINNPSGLMLLRPSHTWEKLVETKKGLEWKKARPHGSYSPRRLHTQEVHVTPGAHEVERIDNPFIPGGEPWLVLKGSRIGAAEAYLKRLAAETHGTSNAVQLVADHTAPVVLSLCPMAEAA